MTNEPLMYHNTILTCGQKAQSVHPLRKPHSPIEAIVWAALQKFARGWSVREALASCFAEVRVNAKRRMNMLYEGLKENSTIVIVPSTAVESMQLGGLAGMTALTMGLGQDRPNGQKPVEPSNHE